MLSTISADDPITILHLSHATYAVYVNAHIYVSVIVHDITLDMQAHCNDIIIGVRFERCTYTCIYLVYIHVSPFLFPQESCVNLWPATENENYEVACNEFLPCGGYDVIKLDIANLTSVSKAVTA